MLKTLRCVSYFINSLVLNKYIWLNRKLYKGYDKRILYSFNFMSIRHYSIKLSISSLISYRITSPLKQLPPTPSKTLDKPSVTPHTFILINFTIHHCHKQSSLLSLSFPFIYLSQVLNKFHYALTLEWT